MVKRLFVAIDPPESTKQSLATLPPKLRGIRLTDPDQLHLTISFFGNVTPEADAQLRARLGAIEWKPFFLPIKGVGVFPTKGRPNVLWVGVGTGHPHLFQLHKRVQEAALAAAIEPDLRSFHPHITIARCRDLSSEAMKPFLRTQADFDAGMIHVQECHLYSSKLTPAGSIHIRELTLRAS